MASPPDSACPWLFVLAFALPMPPSRLSGLERCSTGAPSPVVSCGQKQDLSGFLVTPPIPLPCSETPAEPVFLAIAAFPMLPPDPTRRRLQHLHDFEVTAGLQYPLSTLHERRCRHPCKTRFRLAGSAVAGGRRTLWVTMKGFRSFPSSFPGLVLTLGACLSSDWSSGCESDSLRGHEQGFSPLEDR